MRRVARLLATLMLGPVLTGGRCARELPPAVASSRALILDKAALAADLAELTRQPHPLGSSRQQALAAWLQQRVEATGWRAIRADFLAQVPNPDALLGSGPLAETNERRGSNVYARSAAAEPAPCVVAFASHFDTKDLTPAAYVGANDSASSTALLLQILRHLKQNSVYSGLRCDFAAFFFDGEEAVLPHWSDGERVHPAHLEDHTYGSRTLAASLVPCAFDGKPARCLPGNTPGSSPGPALLAVVLLDMVGSPQLQLTAESNSSPRLRAAAQTGAVWLGYPNLFGPEAAIEDDHRPFLNAGVEALDLIDFNHLTYWHQRGDEAGTLADDSIQIAGQLALFVAATAATTPPS